MPAKSGDDAILENASHSQDYTSPAYGQMEDDDSEPSVDDMLEFVSEIGALQAEHEASLDPAGTAAERAERVERAQVMRIVAQAEKQLGVPFACNFCHETFTRSWDLKGHLQAHLEGDDKLHK